MLSAMNKVQYAECKVQSAVYNVQNALCRGQCAKHNVVQFAICRVKCVERNLQCEGRRVQGVKCTVQVAICIFIVYHLPLGVFN